jgi:hypothetical protein
MDDENGWTLRRWPGSLARVRVTDTQVSLV